MRAIAVHGNMSLHSLRCLFFSFYLYIFFSCSPHAHHFRLDFGILIWAFSFFTFTGILRILCLLIGDFSQLTQICSLCWPLFAKPLVCVLGTLKKLSLRGGRENLVGEIVGVNSCASPSELDDCFLVLAPNGRIVGKTESPVMSGRGYSV